MPCCSTAHCTNGAVRLVDGPDDSQGRVEVCISSVWGTISDDGWGNLDGRVVCGMLGYSNKGEFAVYSFKASMHFKVNCQLLLSTSAYKC